MNIVLWIIQILLGGALTMSGLTLLTQPKEKIGDKMTFVHDYSKPMLNFIGISKIAGGLGLILPWLTGILPILTPIAATGMAIFMVFAMMHHLKKKEYRSIPVNAVFMILCLLVAYGRF